MVAIQHVEAVVGKDAYNAESYDQMGTKSQVEKSY